MLRAVRREGDAESARLSDLEKSRNTALGPSLLPGPKPSLTQQVATKIQAQIKQTIADTKKQIDQKVLQSEALAAPKTASTS